MFISPISRTNFTAGNIYNFEGLRCRDAIKKIAEDRQLDITLHDHSQLNIPYFNNLFSVLAVKSDSKMNDIAVTPLTSQIGASSTTITKNMSKEEKSVRVFNAAIKAIEHLNKQIIK